MAKFSCTESPECGIKGQANKTEGQFQISNCALSSLSFLFSHSLKWHMGMGLGDLH